ncbi:MAG: tRNA (guanosine(46)-N7)-methyltransferase TrmB [Gemmataceae bacterium]|nr:tRNA (guanosine(46)-N7)-methyltransferase TrmB [Gemmataceae bacterium]
MARLHRLPLEALRPLLVEVPHPRTPAWRELSATSRPLSWPELFGNDRPVEIEVGSGKGMFLINAASTRPETNFLGIEIERKYALLAASRLVQRGLANVRLACTDGRWLLEYGVASESVQAIHVYFPDPWWKHRHHKRRLLTADFARHCARTLRPGGLLHFASDVAAYFEESCRLLVEAAGLQPVTMAETSDGAYLSHFERKYRLQGRTIYRGRFLKAR